MKDLKMIRLYGHNNQDDDMEQVSSLERQMSKESILNDGTGYVGLNGVRVTTYFIKDGVYTVATNGMGINSKTGGMWNAHFYHRNTPGYTRVLDNCKKDNMGAGNTFQNSVFSRAWH
ncbi:MAG: Unknown protein [uncultured Sulfurovum sp.]|uniref:Uncharacterized protein n=1 Tax=uncultured Sulfurovum sp. TaxID=269237 RepID=A0A6S6SSM0_9BACT|nr:MAG: Unknown protein [uncultured Sulfurovum sp.]